MTVTLIAAMAANRVIGRAGRLPWDLPVDRRRFREITWGHPVIMGRKTFASIGNPLPGRTNIVLTHQAEWSTAGCVIVHDLAAALAAAAAAEGGDEVFVIGGADLYDEALPLAERIHLTLLPGEVAGDVYFPEIPADFRLVARDERPGPPPCTFLTYERHLTPAPAHGHADC